MSSSFYVLKSVHSDPQINEEIRTGDEVTRVREGGYIFCVGRNLARWAGTWGFNAIIDPTKELCGDDGVTFKEAGKILKIPAGAVASMAKAGKFDLFTHPESGESALRREQVLAHEKARPAGG